MALATGAARVAAGSGPSGEGAAHKSAATASAGAAIHFEIVLAVIALLRLKFVDYALEVVAGSFLISRRNRRHTHAAAGIGHCIGRRIFRGGIGLRSGRRAGASFAHAAAFLATAKRHATVNT